METNLAHLLFTTLACLAMDPPIAPPVAPAPIMAGPYRGAEVGSFEILVPITKEQRDKGLRHIKAIPQGHGMVFFFKDGSPALFDTREYLVKVDLVFIGEDGKLQNVVTAEPTLPGTKDGDLAHWTVKGRLNPADVNKVNFELPSTRFVVALGHGEGDRFAKAWKPELAQRFIHADPNHRVWGFVRGGVGKVQKGQSGEAVNAIVREETQKSFRTHGQCFEGPEEVPSMLLKELAGKRLIALGEGSHGTSEVFTLNGKITLELAKRGKVILFWEDSTASLMPINDWIHGAGLESDLDRLMTEGLYGIRKTIEVATFLKAARKFNAAVPPEGQLELFGVDPNMFGSMGIPGFTNPSDVTTHLQTFNTANKLGLDSQIATCSGYLNDPNSITPQSRARAHADALLVFAKIESLGSTAKGRVEALVLAKNLVAFLQMEHIDNNAFKDVALDVWASTPSSPLHNAIRDTCMAENIRLLMDAKIPRSGVGVFWAHNFHIGRLSYLNQDPDAAHPSATVNTGSILGLWLGDSYYPVGMLIGKGTFRAVAIEADGSFGGYEALFAPSPIDPNSLNGIATATFPEKPTFFSTKDLPFRWQTRPELAIKSGYERTRPGSAWAETIPGMAYDGAVSFPNSSAAIALPRPASK